MAFNEFIQIAPSFLCYSVFTSDSSHCPYFTRSLKIPRGCVLILLLLAKELCRRALTTGGHCPSGPFPCPAASPLLGAARGGWAPQESSISRFQISPPRQGSLEILLSPSFDAGETPRSLSLLSKKEKVVGQFRKRKGKWEENSCPRLCASSAQLLRDVFPCVLSAVKLMTRLRVL